MLEKACSSAALAQGVEATVGATVVAAAPGGSGSASIGGIFPTGGEGQTQCTHSQTPLHRVGDVIRRANRCAMRVVYLS